MSIRPARRMRFASVKTVRFSQVVAKCGKPVVHDQWVAATKDAALKKAINAGRLMTVHIHTVGAKKDHGVVGLVDAAQRVLLVFPKSLAAFKERRIVGIDYDQLKEGPQRAKKPAAKVPKETTAHRKAPMKPSEAALRLFNPEERTEEEEPTKQPPKRKASAQQPRPKAQIRKPANKRAHVRQPTANSNEGPRLRTQIKQAMKQLQSGKAVQAFQTLENALA